MLTRQQFKRRSIFLLGSVATAAFYFGFQQNYIAKKLRIFEVEYSMLKSNPNFYHTLHE